MRNTFKDTRTDEAQAIPRIEVCNIFAGAEPGKPPRKDQKAQTQNTHKGQLWVRH